MVRHEAEPTYLFSALARAARDASLSSEDRQCLFDAVEALASSYETPDFGLRYAELVVVAEQHLAFQQRVHQYLPKLAALLH